RTGRDVVIAALLGAEEFGFATAPLVVMGCVMMRVCHLDTCPVGIATQNPELRDRFSGKAEHVVSFFRFIAEEVRGELAALGFRSLDEIVGRADLLEPRPAPEAATKARALDLSRILDAAHVSDGRALRSTTRAASTHPLRPLDKKMLDLAEPALFYGETVRAELEVTNRDRAIGTTVGSEITRRYGGRGLPPGTLTFHLKGSAGQSLGAFLPAGIALLCEGDANDYVAKGLSGGTVALFPPAKARFRADENVIAGNVILYGATSGKAFLRGKVGERFAVRNSGASAVVEGVGDHACEYMTGGVVVVIGATGRNFAAGMSGGVAYVLGDPGDVEAKVNLSMVALRPMGEDDLRIVRELLEEHREITGSEVANGLLLGWEAARLAFTKIMPLEYERALAESEKRRLETLEPPTSGVVAAE
ncbi:MAG: glutamate synthase subunit alpha, partial [Polyangiaceae bacterium]|nr:glutamate synthase subunit alpha [Polyangiaceae bacterium]